MPTWLPSWGLRAARIDGAVLTRATLRRHSSPQSILYQEPLPSPFVTLRSKVVVGDVELLRHCIGRLEDSINPQAQIMGA
jgi:hypothetical protein